jgi:hypothetical protein
MAFSLDEGALEPSLPEVSTGIFSAFTLIVY